jgi:FtsZ-interacting cell division protein ZipA
VSISDALPVIELTGAEREGSHGTGGISLSDEVAIDVPAEATGTQPRERPEPYIGQDDEISAVRVFDEKPVVGPQLVLAWPPENERRIVTLRIVPKTEPRFGGRALRQAFASSGFWHGPLDIYHLPDSKGRVVLSAAALAQPGTFDPSIMDSQRFSGLNMFAVLPGPVPERETFDELVHAARSLAERLGGTITDQHGEELTSQRVARLRQSLEAPAQARASGEA